MFSLLFLSWSQYPAKKIKCDQSKKKKIVAKFENSNCDQTQTQIVIKQKETNCDKTKKNQIVTKLKNSNCDKTQKLKL